MENRFVRADRVDTRDVEEGPLAVEAREPSKVADIPGQHQGRQ
ncbi:hypothetical protein [Kitasatospora sp. NPDC094016]